MANTQVYDDNSQVYLSFTLNDPLTAQTRQARIRELLKKKFGEGEVEQVIALHEGVNEIVFRISTPAVHTSDMLKHYFESLYFVMNATEDLKPHFTQTVRSV